MTDDFPRPLGRDDQPHDATGDDRLERLPGQEAEDAGDAVAPSIVDFEDHERFDVDDPQKPGIDDYTD